MVYELLGGSPADLLLPRNFLIVEGPSEVELLSRVIKRFYVDRPQLHILPANGDTHQANRSINAIRKAYSPLQSTLYEGRVVVLCDAPSEKAKVGFEEFLKEFEEMHKRGQIHVLPNGSLEECYPKVEDWNRSAEQVSKMEGKAKIKLARRVGEQITQEQFERDMGNICEALTMAWKLAY